MEIVADYLTSRGHDVMLVSTAPRRATEQLGRKMRILRKPLWARPLGLLHVEPQHTFFFTSLRSLGSLDAEVIHSFFYSDALAAAWTRRRKGWRTILQLNGVAIPRVSCHRFPPEAWMMRKAIEQADEFIVCSRFIQQLAKEYYGREARVIEPPVDLSDWPLGEGPREGGINILSVGNFEVRRKGVRVLARAFQQLKRQEPRAVLQLSGHISPETIAEITEGLPPEVKRDVRVLGMGRVGDLPALYQNAAITVLPAMWEPSGGAVLESLASGTPVVAANHGGVPEFLTTETGRLFDPQTAGEETHNARGLCDAMLEGLELAKQRRVREMCRARAEQFSTRVQGPVLERLYANAC